MLCADRACLHEFLRRREHGAAEPRDATIENVQQQVSRRHCQEILVAPVCDELILAIAFNDDARG